MKKAKIVSKYTCGDCTHRWACAAQRGGGSIVSMMESNAINCANFRYEIIHTRGDEIRNMSDEDLAAFLEGLVIIALGEPSMRDNRRRLDWLRQPNKRGPTYAR